MEQPTRRIGLALGGGGGRGSAHIGVISELERLHIPIDVIAGTSVGGVVGILYAAGRTPSEIETLFRAATVRRIAARDASSYGLIGTSKIEAWLRDELGAHTTFADLRLPIAVVAVDLLSGDEVVISEGSVVEALLATIAVPGFFPPRQRGEQLLADGMLRNNLPVDVARKLGADKVIAVDLHNLQRNFTFQNAAQRAAWSPRRWVPLSQFTVLDRSVDIMLRQITAHRLEQCPPDILLKPLMPGLTPFDITRATEGRAAGAAAVGALEPAIRALGAWRAGLEHEIVAKYYPEGRTIA